MKMLSNRNDRRKTQIGTRFRLFPQPPFIDAFSEPETVEVSTPAGSIGPGPSDQRMYVVDPIGKPMAFGDARKVLGDPTLFMPPWQGDRHPPVEPTPDGHFDHVKVGTRAFEAAHLYGSVRRTLDIWEGYFGHELAWHFGEHYDQLELVVEDTLKENAYMGYGYLEVGYHEQDNGEIHPFSLNFDIIAHEVGHLIVYSMVGVASAQGETGEYYGFHESAADLTALIASLHFDSVLDDLLSKSRGNLYTYNLTNRIGELSANDQIRLAANPLTLADFMYGWEDEHKLAQPLTGAMFDILIDIFHEELVERDLISAVTEDMFDQAEDLSTYHELVQPIFDKAYEIHPEAIKVALEEARDTIGKYLAEAWRLLSANHLNYVDVADALMSVDEQLTNGRYGRILYSNLHRRGIGSVAVGPELPNAKKDGHSMSDRSFVPSDERCAPSYRRRAPRRINPNRFATRRGMSI
ncbi:MAG: hypothetical protein ABJN26_02740 [Stappiaceae bacterium]